MQNFILAALLLTTTSVMAEPRSVTVDIWVDNWFEMYANGTRILEDSVPITTERSFNAETITFSAKFPMTIAIIARDFKENESGLEYIGTRRQQMGDGGMIAQFRNAITGEIVAVTDSAMRCLTIQRAPVDRLCADEANPIAGEGVCAFVKTDIPANWMTPDFDDSHWPSAVEHSAREVRPKGGYDNISWANSAKLVWSNDLVQDNTLLCRMTISDQDTS